MQKDVIISIDGNNFTDDGNVHNVTIVTQGIYDVEDGVHTLRYSEADEETGESIETTILVHEDRVVVMDDVSFSQVMFRHGQRFSSLVQDEESKACVELGVFPTRVKIDMNEEFGSVDLNYQMDMDGIVMGDNSIRVSYRSADV